MTRLDIPGIEDGAYRTCRTYRILRTEVEPIEGQLLLNVHAPGNCVGRPCVIHNPTNHHMRGWFLLWRDDRRIFERICPHGVGHPDPDQFGFWKEIGHEHEGTHGCCSAQCCRGNQ